MKLRWYIAVPCVLGLILLAIVGWRVRVLTARTKLIIAADTTQVLGPVRPDGTIDFEAALNARYAVGVTPENNAVVLLDRAFTPEFESIPIRIRYYQYLGVPEPLRGPCMVSEEEFAKQKWGPRSSNGKAHIDFEEQCTAAMAKPWTRTEYPDIAEWIDANEEPSKLIEEATLRTRFYDPLVTSGYLIASQLSFAQKTRSATRILVTRAMLRISEGDLDAAARDLLTCHRLGRLLSQHATMIGNLIAFAIEATANTSDQMLLSAELSGDQARDLLGKLQSLSDLPNIARTLDQSERLVSLDTLQSEWASGEASMVRAVPTKLSGLDINVVLRRTNASYDNLVAALKLPRWKDRQTAVTTLSDELKDRVKQIVSGREILSSIAFGGRTAISEKVADVYLEMTGATHPHVQTGKERAETRFKLLKIGLALTIYRSDTGKYPETLEFLVPKYAKTIPLDPFVEKPLHYKRLLNDQSQEQGYLLYSVGENETDDGGLTPANGNSNDVVFRVTHDDKSKLPSPQTTNIVTP